MSNSEIFDIFPTPIRAYKNPNHKNHKKFILDYKNKTKNYKNNSDKNLIHWGCNGTSVSVIEEFQELKEWVKKCSIDFIVDVCGYELRSDVVITDSWLNECFSGGSQKFHFHSNSFISGTYYVNYDQNLHAPLQFKRYSLDSSTRQSISLPRKNPNQYSTDAAIFPEEGELVLWESHVTHGYENNANDERISLSVNIIPEILDTGIYKFKITRL